MHIRQKGRTNALKDKLHNNPDHFKRQYDIILFMKKYADDNERFMNEAIKEAKKAYALEECPIGCVLVKDGKIIARAHNQKVTKNNALMHAEVIAINKACKKLNDWHLNDCDMYVTLEPCTMCSGAMIQSRVRKVYFGAYEPKSGAVCSCNNIFDTSNGHNHFVDSEGGVLQDECSSIMKSFFKEIREKHKQTPHN